MKLQVRLNGVYENEDHLVVEDTLLHIDEKEIKYDTTVIPLQELVMHAISNDLNNFPYPCIYCQLEDERELRFAVKESKDLDTIFEVLCKNIEQLFKQDEEQIQEEQEEEECNNESEDSSTKKQKLM